MKEQEFRILIEQLRPSLNRLAARNRFLGCIDRDDLYQEALINLWNRIQGNEFKDKTRGYIIKSCYFHIQNYIRTHKVNNRLVSIDEPLYYNDDAGGTLSLKDILEDNKSSFFEDLNSKLIVDGILNNGLSKREKDVARYLYQGLNLREIAKKIGISHVGVLKIKKNICLKYKKKFFDK